LPAKATECLYLFPYHTKNNDQEHEEDEENIAQVLQTYYIRPRAYPNTEIDYTTRIKALANLQNMRIALNKPHITTGFLGRVINGDNKSGGPGATGDSGPYWESEGSTNINGKVTGLAIDPNNKQHLFASTVGGIWRSRDGSRRWERVSDDFIAGTCSSVAINPRNGEEIFAGTGNPNTSYKNQQGGIGIWRSTAGGDPGTWSKVSPVEMDGPVIYRLRIDPAAPHNIYAATSGGLYLGTRSGSSITWALLKKMDADATDVVVDFSATPHTVYAAVAWGSTTFDAGVWKFDGGSWRKRDAGIPAGGRKIALALAASNPQTLYAKIESASSGEILGIFKTTTGGTAWSNVNLPADYLKNEGDQVWHNCVIEVDPADANTVYVGGIELYRSTTGGATWDDISSGADPSYPISVHVDQHAIIFDPMNSKNIFVGNDGGVFYATGTFDATWHWNQVSHGMVSAEFHHIATQHTAASIIAGGTQDNGTIITFGNRTWYHFGGGDGHDVAFDAGDYLTIYLKVGSGLAEHSNPVPNTVGFNNVISHMWKTPTNYVPVSPVVTDPTTPGAALAAGGAPTVKKGAPQPPPVPARLLKTTDGITWDFASDALPAGATISFIGVAPSSLFKTYYLGIDGPTPAIWRTVNGGTNWTTTSTGLPGKLLPNAVAVDLTNANRAVVGLGGNVGGSVAITTDTGATWHSLNGSGAEAFPANTPVTGVVFDPFDPNTVYVASTVGVFKGRISAVNPPSGSWAPFDDGPPAGADVNDIFVNKAEGILHISTLGYGAFRCDIKPGVKNRQVMLVVRDNVFDHGNTPSTPAAGFPNPENPVADPARSGFYKPGDPVYWWSSPDIRIDVPSLDPVANQLANVDHVEFESTPLHIAPALPGTMLDSNPVAGQPAKVYVQVANRGLQPATNVKVLALWAEASTGLPLLPKDFWSTTFPAGSGKCGPLASECGWHFVDPSDPCKVISANPIMPEVVGFDWKLPKDAAAHSCVMAIIDSDQDPIVPKIRGELNPSVIVPASKNIGLRNLHIVDVPSNQTISEMPIVNVANPHPDKQSVEMRVTCGTLGSGFQVGMILPHKMSVKSTGTSVKSLPISDANKALAAKLMLDATAVYTLTESSADFSSVPVPAGQTIKFGLVIDGGKAVAGTVHYITISTHEGATLLGGNTFMLRVPST
jgi:photosystem II stability/assembly factor-like uncharacterized protein